MLGGLARTPASVSVSGLPTGSYILFPNSEDNGNFYTKDWQGNVKPMGSLNPVMGGGRVFAKRTDQLNESGTNLVTYLTLNIPNSSSVSVTHEVIVQYVWGFGSGSQDFRGEIQLGGTLIDKEHRQEPKDPGADQRHSYCFMDEIQVPPGGATLTVKFRSSSAGNEARMYSAKARSHRV